MRLETCEEEISSCAILVGELEKPLTPVHERSHALAENSVRRS